MARSEKEKEMEKGKEEGVVEILVHTTAPCRGKDDSHYRALASAYLLFEPVSRLSLDDDHVDNRLSALETRGGCHPCGSLEDSTAGELPQWAGPKTAIFCADDDIYGVSQPQDQFLERYDSTCPRAVTCLESPQASFRSVLDNLNSPVLKKSGVIRTPSPSGKRKISHLVVENESSWETPPSIIPDSQSPYNRVVPEFSSPTKILELYRQHFDASKIVPTSTDGDETSQLHAASTMDFQLDSSQPAASNPPQGTAPELCSAINESIQVIHDTPFAEHQREPQSPNLLRKNKAPLPTPPTFLRPGYEPASTRSDGSLMLSPLSAKQSTQSSKRPTLSTSPLQKRRKIEVCATPAKLSQARTPLTKIPSKTRHHLQPCVTPHEIHPPPPRTSICGSRPPQIITPALYHLAVQLELPRRFRPASQTRPLRDLERGYWAISTASWPCPMREQAWAALGAYVGQGKAGWGVWGVRCLIDCAGVNGGGPDEGGEHSGWRVYCWGGVAGHVYLLLYLVSQRRVKGTGARWVDGGGEVAVWMP